MNVFKERDKIEVRYKLTVGTLLVPLCNSLRKNRYKGY
jgi:hypothetical protein